jgi:hypothetical protein
VARRLFHLPIAGFWAETQKVEDTVREESANVLPFFSELAGPGQSDSQAHVSGVIEQCFDRFGPIQAFTCDVPPECVTMTGALPSQAISVSSGVDNLKAVEACRGSLKIEMRANAVRRRILLHVSSHCILWKPRGAPNPQKMVGMMHTPK